jgi:hypothetical protein
MIAVADSSGVNVGRRLDGCAEPDRERDGFAAAHCLQEFEQRWLDIYALIPHPYNARRVSNRVNFASPAPGFN